jgi:uncharacterized protein YndB with AHSA1/START domain
MPKLFVEKSIVINAPVSRVWEILTQRDYTARWASEFSNGSQFFIESDWQPGSRVLWIGPDGEVVVEGNVTALKPNRLLRFTVFDVRSPERPPVGDEDGITYELSEENGKTTLHVRQGDFSVMTNGEKYQQMSAQIWDRVLPKVQSLAEKKD